jgi:hypothetical protein
LGTSHASAPAPDRWGEVFGDEVVAAAMIDLLVRHADCVTLVLSGTGGQRFAGPAWL